MSLRVVRWPGTDWLTDASRNPVRIQEWLERHAPQLAAVKIEPTEMECELTGALWQIDGHPVRYSPGFWIGRCANAARVSVWGAIITAQKEQDLLNPDQPFEDYRWERMPDGFAIPADHVAAKGPIGTRYYFDKNDAAEGCVKVHGDRRMSSCLGFGIPDPGKRCGWSLTKYGPQRIPIFGFCSQVAHFNWYLRRQIDAWEGGKRTVLLYGGETVECADPLIYWALRYTPAENIADFLCKIADGKGVS